MYDTHRRPPFPPQASGSARRHEGRHGDGTVRNTDTTRPPSGVAAETGTTVVGLTAGNAAVLAADRRASLGGRFVTNKSVRKVQRVHPTAAIASSGGVGDIQELVRTLRAETRLYEDRRGSPLSIPALATLIGTVLRTQSLRVTPLVGGVDADGPHLFAVDGGGGALRDAYAAAGSGTQLAYGALESRFDPAASVPEARETAVAAVATASERDTASGNGFTVATVTPERVEIDAGPTRAEVSG